jgi:hypothetical protein
MGIIAYSQLVQVDTKERHHRAPSCGKTVYGSPKRGALFEDSYQHRNRAKQEQL